MVTKMNKNGFVKKLSELTGYDVNQCNKINDIIEDTFIIGKEGKERIIQRFKSELNFDEKQVNHLYQIVLNILKSEISNKLKHPFKSQDS